MSDTINALQSTIQERKRNPREGSYTCKLFSDGLEEILKKVGEEATEVVVAGALQGADRVVYETADLVYHLMVLLVEQDIEWSAIEEELARRFK